ncbi:MAG: DUF2656 domain-containing protein [Calothrix sp. FI2-JRJ7]|jgi:hypothetical protein|nr:DUF2656 domain-containing protein [Calothrix sp. FI2-JRJ7]
MATQGRMLLSHNFDVSEEVIPLLSRDAFVFGRYWVGSGGCDEIVW